MQADIGRSTIDDTMAVSDHVRLLRDSRYSVKTAKPRPAPNRFGQIGNSIK
jgi:hypothetical protein